MPYVMAPDGQVCQIPEGQLETALADGGRLLTEREVSIIVHKKSMAVRWFEHNYKSPNRRFRLKRRSKRG